MRILTALLLCVMPAFAQSAIAPPLLGIMRDSGNQLRRVFGVAGAFALSDAEQRDISGVAFSGRFGLVKTGSQVLVLDERGAVVRSLPAPQGKALFAFDAAGRPGLCYFLDTAELWRIKSDGVLDVLHLTTANVLAIALTDAERAKLVVYRDNGLWLVTRSVETGALETEEPLSGLSGPALFFKDGALIHSEADALIWNERRIRLPSRAETLERMGEEWILVGQRNALTLAVRLNGREVKSYRLPAVEAAP